MELNKLIITLKDRKQEGANKGTGTKTVKKTKPAQTINMTVRDILKSITNYSVFINCFLMTINVGAMLY